MAMRFLVQLVGAIAVGVLVMWAASRIHPSGVVIGLAGCCYTLGRSHAARMRWVETGRW